MYLNFKNVKKKKMEKNKWSLRNSAACRRNFPQECV